MPELPVKQSFRPGEGPCFPGFPSVVIDSYALNRKQKYFNNVCAVLTVKTSG